MFQFLIGSLEAELWAKIRREEEFQFLIGSLEAALRAVLVCRQILSFNSS